MCTSTYAFNLPPNVRRGVALRFYQPTEFVWWPPGANSPGTRSYRRSLVQDNYFAVPPTAELLWIVEGSDWTDALCTTLDRCLERVTYFGRAESLTEILRFENPSLPEPNVFLHEDVPSPDAVPVLAPEPSATAEDVQRVTSDDHSRRRTVPPGARWLYAVRPPRPAIRESVATPTQRVGLPHLVQFALGVAVAPEPRAVCHLTSAFRQQLLRLAAKERAGALGLPSTPLTWSRAPAPVRSELALLAGRDAEGRPLKGHQHLRLAVWFEGQRPVRLLAWRHLQPFRDWELDALHVVADSELAWQQSGGGAVPGWAVRLIPLHPTTPPPDGFSGRGAAVWDSVTPYVPPRHWFRKNGSARPADDVSSQVARELAQLGFEVKGLIVETRGARWTSVHLPPAGGAERRTGDKRGFLVRLEFPHVVAGPIAIGHSSHYGLGLFRPALGSHGRVGDTSI
jgi:CRISPR-associated protein Csb2